MAEPTPKATDTGDAHPATGESSESATEHSPPLPGRPWHGRLPRELGEPYWQAQLAVIAAIALQLTLPAHLTVGPTWLIPALEAALLFGLRMSTPRRHHDESPRRRAAAISMIALVNAANIVSLSLLLHYLLHHGHTPVDGRSLILSSVAIYLTNVIVFGLWFWEIDRGGPGRRARHHELAPDWQFPQMTAPEPRQRDWQPGFIDYLYVSLTNALAFSPTDAMPLTPRAKILMGIEGLVSLVTIALVAARAVNILA